MFQSEQTQKRRAQLFQWLTKTMFGLLKTFYVKPHERAFLFYRSHFQGILEPGVHRRMGWHWRVQLFDLNESRPQIENLEFLLHIHRQIFEQYFVIVQTQEQEAALVQVGPKWFVVRINSLDVFWRGLHEVQVHRFNLAASREIPREFVPVLRQFNWTSLQLVQITEDTLCFLYDRGNFERVLAPGDYAFWTLNAKFSYHYWPRDKPAQIELPHAELLFTEHAEKVTPYLTQVVTNVQEVALLRYRNRIIGIVPPSQEKVCLREVAIATINLEAGAQLSPALVNELQKSAFNYHEHVCEIEVPAQHVGLLYDKGVFQMLLQPGIYAWWQFGHAFRSVVIDLRLQTLEVAGQEILSKDKVPLRLNLTAGYRLTDAVQAQTHLKDIEGFLYKELQFALRSAVGTKTLDELLEDKGAIDTDVSAYIQPKVANYGIAVDSVGVKDIILPGDMKLILAQVVEAQKLAQANVIRRREETAATRSMLNTAKVMENNPIALRLKELEVLERIAEKIERINVNGSLDTLLSEMIHLNQASGE